MKKDLRGMLKLLFLGVFLISMVSSFTVGIAFSTIKSNAEASSEEILLAKNSIIEDITKLENVSQFAGGSKMAELTNCSMDKLQSLVDKGVTIVIYGGNNSYVDIDNKTVYVSIKGDNGQIIDFVNDILSVI